MLLLVTISACNGGCHNSKRVEEGIKGKNVIKNLEDYTILGNGLESDGDAYWIEYEINGEEQYGIMKENGEVMPYENRPRRQFYTSFYNEIALLSKDNGICQINTEGEISQPIIIAEGGISYSFLASGGGYVALYKNDRSSIKIGVLDYEGNWIVEPTFEGMLEVEYLGDGQFWLRGQKIKIDTNTGECTEAEFLKDAYGVTE